MILIYFLDNLNLADNEFSHHELSSFIKTLYFIMSILPQDRIFIQLMIISVPKKLILLLISGILIMIIFLKNIFCNKPFLNTLLNLFEFLFNFILILIKFNLLLDRRIFNNSILHTYHIITQHIFQII